MDRRSFFMPKPMGKYKRLEVFYLSKPVYTADKPSDCHMIVKLNMQEAEWNRNLA